LQNLDTMKKLAIVLLSFFFAQAFLLAQNNALEFDGEDDYVWSTENISALSEGTFELWFRSDTAQYMVLAVGGNDFPIVNWDIGYRLGEHSTAGIGLAFGIFRGPWIWAQSGLEPENGEWYHVASTWGPAGLKIYINGSLKSTVEYFGPTREYVYDIIGVSTWGGYFDGAIDEVRFWNFARDSAQINATMMNTLGMEYIQNPDSGLLAYYKFDSYEDLAIDQDGQDDLRDYSAAANHADSRGTPQLITSGAFNYEGLEPIAASNIAFILYQNQPNPFNTKTTIRFTIPQTENIKLSIFNFLGEEIKTLVSRKHMPGTYSYDWKPVGLPEGLYYVRMEAGSYSDTRKMVLTR